MKKAVLVVAFAGAIGLAGYGMASNGFGPFAPKDENFAARGETAAAPGCGDTGDSGGNNTTGEPEPLRDC